ncbi:MAG: DUF1080 domain-containing protein [Verrucomicrobia bacterium]|nr:DUF1080 domain-containing protein [Verrucomicrobiota bacterium]
MSNSATHKAATVASIFVDDMKSRLRIISGWRNPAIASGGVYGFLTPRLNGSKPAGEWQSMDITLIGRLVSVTLNGQPIIENQIIPGITGGALDSHEGEPGPILIQGDHGPVEYRRITLSTLSE